LSEHSKKILVIGYGNPARADDGLGPAFAEAVEKLNLPGVTVEANYQLGVEDAHEVSAHEIVVFADAAAEGTEPFFFRSIEPRGRMSFSSHSLDPASVLALAQELFGAKTQAYLLGIRGYDFEAFNESLTPRAGGNLADAIRFFSTCAKTNSFSQKEGEINSSAKCAARRENERA
jgi:hydrogenase maturation protease